MQYREQTYKNYALLFGGGEQEDKEQTTEGATIGSKYGWYILIHKIAGGDILKMNKVTKEGVNTCLNWLAYTKEVELEEERNKKSN